MVYSTNLLSHKKQYHFFFFCNFFLSIKTSWVEYFWVLKTLVGETSESIGTSVIESKRESLNQNHGIHGRNVSLRLSSRVGGDVRIPKTFKIPNTNI